MPNQRFHFHSLKELHETIQQEKLDLPLSDNIGLLDSPLKINNWQLPNRIVFQPMEGCDGTASGQPGELTIRRYQRFASGGPAIIWMEAVAIVPEGRANPRQLFLSEENLDSFKRLITNTKEISRDENGYEPKVIVQLTHSGRYSKPNGTPHPLIAYNNPLFEGQSPIPQEQILSDDYLKGLEEAFGKAAHLVEQTGADGADIKCCHRYLLCELLSAFNRKGEYGGSFENRTRLYRNAITAAQADVSSNFMITSRLNAYDGFPYPYGFGVREGNGLQPDLTETLQLVKILVEQMKMPLLNITAGNPYVNAYVNRPSDVPDNLSVESPLTGVTRILNCCSTIQTAFPKLNVIASGLSYLRQYSPYVAAGMIEQGRMSLAGFGREAFAYPTMLHDLRKGGMDGVKCCIACGKCSEMMRAGTVTGCVIRDSEVYAPIYKEHVQKSIKE